MIDMVVSIHDLDTSRMPIYRLNGYGQIFLPLSNSFERRRRRSI